MKIRAMAHHSLIAAKERSMDKRIAEAEELLQEFLESHIAQSPKCTCALPTKYAIYIKKYYPEQFVAPGFASDRSAE